MTNMTDKQIRTKLNELKLKAGEMFLLPHAKERLSERLGLDEERGLKLIQRIVQEADMSKDVVTGDSSRESLTIDSANKYIRIVVNYRTKAIITLMTTLSNTSDVQKAEEFVTKVHQEFSRKQDILLEELDREEWRVNIRLHEAKLLLATKELNLLKAKRPETIEVIKRDILQAKHTLEGRERELEYIERKRQFVKSIEL